MSRDRSNFADLGPVPKKGLRALDAMLCLARDRSKVLQIGAEGGRVGRPDPGRFIPHFDLTEFDDRASSPVSRRHAEFRWKDNRLEIADLGSKCGTFVNGVKLEPRDEGGLCISDWVSLKVGDVVTFADVEFEVTVIG